MGIICACLSAGKPFLWKYMPNIIGSSYGASIRTKRRTMPSTYTQHLSLRNTGADHQDIILEGDLNSKLRRHAWAAYRLANSYDIS